jgi:hypothetical protein
MGKSTREEKVSRKSERRGARLGLLASLLLLVAAGCGASSAPSSSPRAPVASQEAAYDSSVAPGSPPPAPESSRSGASAGAVDVDRQQPSEQPPGDRPGLATHWGESRASFIKTTTFYRADDGRPSTTATFWYNDREGARAMAQAEGFRALDQAQLPVAQAGIAVSLRDERGRALPGYSVNGKTFAVGEAGSRYTITLTNSTPARFEIVASVDGLDVHDGRPASFSKRGYILNPHASLEIEGFRQSESAVAAFRFGSVRGSYAERKGDDRNVGVIGIAVFHERGFPMWPWDPQEIERRKNANPFPGQYATPPP